MAPQELPRRTLDDGTQKMKHRETISTELNFEPFSFAKNTAKESITTRKRCSKEKIRKNNWNFVFEIDKFSKCNNTCSTLLVDR